MDVFKRAEQKIIELGKQGIEPKVMLLNKKDYAEFQKGITVYIKQGSSNMDKESLSLGCMHVLVAGYALFVVEIHYDVELRMYGELKPADDGLVAIQAPVGAIIVPKERQVAWATEILRKENEKEKG